MAAASKTFEQCLAVKPHADFKRWSFIIMSRAQAHAGAGITAETCDYGGCIKVISSPDMIGHGRLFHLSEHPTRAEFGLCRVLHLKTYRAASPRLSVCGLCATSVC